MRSLLFAALIGAAMPAALSQSLSAPEYKIKAAFLYNFAVLTEWPTNAFPSAQSPLKIGVLGKDPFDRFLDDAMRGKTVHGRKIQILRFKQLKNIKNCHLLFISSSEEEHLESILLLLENEPVLTVSEIDRFNTLGGIIWLQKENDEIKFRIRKAPARRNGLRLSSKMLGLAINATRKEED